jgi:alanyl-tRNA synthetase
VLRRLIRRAVRHVKLMGIEQRVLRETCGAVIDTMSAAYPILERERILAEVQDEEAKFHRTLEAGGERLAQLVEAAAQAATGTGEAHDASVLTGSRSISGGDAFRLHDTFGFPIDLTVEIAAERGVSVDRPGFEAAMSQQRERSRGVRRSAIPADAELAALESTFIGYPNETRADGLRALAARDANGELPALVVLDRTPFYPEGGGQVGDRGELVGPQGRLSVEDTQRVGEAILHIGRLEGRIGTGDEVEARADERARWGAARNHTATHLLHRALRGVIGEQAKQSGSWVGPDGLRFDFPASGATPREALRDVERRVNEQIRRDATVTPTTMSLAEAQALGADMFFGEKYMPESVRVVQIDGYSKELCGGTHVASTGQIGSFRITSESSIGTGLRRIEAVTGEAAEELIGERLEALRTTALLLGEREENVPLRVEALLARLREAEKAARDGGGGTTRAAARGIDAASALEEAEQAGEARVMIQRFPDADAPSLRALADELRGMTGRFVLVAAGGADGQPALLVAASRDLAGEGFDSAAIVRSAAPLMGGGGGGRAELAQAGGRDASRLDDALREAGRLALEMLKRIETS